MKYLNCKSLVSAVLLGLVSTSAPLLAQQYKAKVDTPKFDDLPSPNINAGKSKRFKPKDWLEVEVKFRLESKDRKQKFADKVTVKWYVVVTNPSKQRGGTKYVLIEKEINHVNVPIGEDIYSSVYLSPTAVMRISGRDRAGKSIVDRVGGEILVNGMAPVKKSGQFSSKGDPGWWNSGSLSRYTKVPLLNKNETPFKFLWWDRYAEIEERQ